jgi:2-beta-glucuronyltransferase
VFLSVRFSALSLVKSDPRSALHGRANRFERVNGIECYLWRTPLHPFATGSAQGNRLTAPLHDLYASWPSADVDGMFRSADVIVVESGLGVLLIRRMRRLNPRALLVYRAADALETIGAHPMLQRRLEESASLVDHYCLVAEGMAPQFAFARARTFIVPHAIHCADFEGIGPNPYAGGRNAVCVGSMLFDRGYFDAAGPAFPDITFHVIGCGKGYGGGANVRVYPEMAFRETLPYVAHADIGVAPYRFAPSSKYLSESSLKLTQYAFLRRPAVCPHFAVGRRAHRFGYAPGNRAEIVAATRAALADRYDATDPTPLSWDDVVPRLLRPRAFADTAIAPERFEDDDITASPALSSPR